MGVTLKGVLLADTSEYNVIVPTMIRHLQDGQVFGPEKPKRSI